MNPKKSNSPPDGAKVVRQKWDSQDATYCWDIYLDRSHPVNNPNVEKLRGYSKARGQSEAQDKDYLLQRKIAMLHKNFYFERMTRIDFFQIADLNRYEKILILHRQHYNIDEVNHLDLFKKHGRWLEEFYKRVRAGKGIEDIIPAVKKEVRNKDEYLSIDRYDFTNVGQLYAHAARLSNFGHAAGAVHHFIDSYKRKKGW